MYIPSIDQIENIIKSLKRLRELKRPGQFGNRSTEITLLSIETFWPEKSKKLPKGDDWYSAANSFIMEVEDPKGGETWPKYIQSLIDDISERIAPLHEFIDKHGLKSLKDHDEIERKLFAVHPEKLTWVIREFKKLKGIIENRQQKVESGNSHTKLPSEVDDDQHKVGELIVIERGQGRNQFSRHLAIKTLIKAYNDRGKPYKISKRTFTRLKNRLNERLPKSQARQIIDAMSFSKDQIKIEKDNPLRLRFEGFSKK